AHPQRRTPAPTVDPALVRQVAGMGNNLDRIARRVNSGEWGPLDRLRSIAGLSAIGRELEERHHDHQIP
ncbi:MobC family plasmid mobilization relaxosome protein, partial [Klebsiella pneumoniae]|uniref:MobC family plasmid mobilization relaxosome protein n=1 Tax=Klebsiella pneumoniae TaxID=573 RepID=UPI001E329877